MEGICQGCDKKTELTNEFGGYQLCDECNSIYDDKTGYCSLNCCLGGSCDDSC